MDRKIQMRSPFGRRALDNAIYKLPFGIVVSDADGLIVSINDVFTSMTGYSLKDVEHKNFQKLLNGPLTNKNAIDEINIACKELKTFDDELIHYRKNGSTFWDEYSSSSILDSEGQVANFICTSKDITDRVTEFNRTSGAQQRVNRKDHLNFVLSSEEIDALFGPPPLNEM